MLEGHNIFSPAPGSIDLDHDISADCWQCHQLSDISPVVTTFNDLDADLTEEPVDSPTTTNSSVPSLSMSSSSSLPERVNLAIEDVVSSEQRFVSQLHRLVDVYLPQLRIPFLESEIPSLTRNIQLILEVHTGLADQLEKSRRSRATLCDILISHKSKLIALHSEFWAGHSGAKTLINRAQLRDPQKWEVWEKQCAAQCSPEEYGSLPRTFEDLIIAPIWRVFTYPFLLGGLRDITKNDQVDIAVNAMKSVATSVDDIGRLSEGEAYTKFILGRMKPVENLNPDFLAYLGPCIRVGTLEVVYHEYPAPPKTPYEPISSPSTPTSSSPITPPHEVLWPTHPKSTRYKRLAVLLWNGYLVLCKIHDKEMEYEPERWFPLRVDPNTEASSSTTSLDTLRSVEVVPSGADFPHGVRITFGRHVFELGAACPADRDTWFHDISSARVNSEEGNELVSRASIHKGQGEGALIARSKSIPQTSPITTAKGLARTLSEGGLSLLRASLNRRAKRQEIGTKFVEQSLSSLAKVGSASLPSAQCSISRKSIANYSSSKDVFDQLVAHGCVDLTSAMDPSKYSSRSVAGGAFADIWKGELYDGTEVAIKVWRFNGILEDGPKQLKRAMREVYYWSKISHPHIQELLGVILFQGRVGMVSPWRKYGNLKDYIKKHQDVDRYALCLQIAKGLSYLHEKNMVHGDLKAGNILVSEEGKVKLSDFDHAILSECTLAFSDTTNFGGGTLRWMAPELVVMEDEGTPCKRSETTDVYSLAMTFLETITTRMPFAEYPHEPRIYGVKGKGEYPKRPQELPRNERSDTMWLLLEQCWNRDPSVRPTASEVLEKLEKLMV